MTDTLASIVLAAGRGTRMKSRLPKLLHRVNWRALPAAVPLKLACRALGIGITKGYGLAREDRFPVPLREVGNAKYRAARTEILAYLGVAETAPARENAA